MQTNQDTVSQARSAVDFLAPAVLEVTEKC